MIQKNLDKWQKYWHNVKHNTNKSHFVLQLDSKGFEWE